MALLVDVPCNLVKFLTSLCDPKP